MFTFRFSGESKAKWNPSAKVFALFYHKAGFAPGERGKPFFP
jgi:hypothetical protein